MVITSMERIKQIKIEVTIVGKKIQIKSLELRLRILSMILDNLVVISKF